MVTFRARIARKPRELPRFVVVPAVLVADWNASFQARVTVNGRPPFWPNVRSWGKEQDVYFFYLTAPQCSSNGRESGNIFDIPIAS